MAKPINLSAPPAPKSNALPSSRTPRTPRKEISPTACVAVAAAGTPRPARRSFPVAPPIGFVAVRGDTRAVYSLVAWATRVGVAASAPATAAELAPPANSRFVFTALALKSVPSWNLMPFFSVIVQVFKSSEADAPSASRPTMSPPLVFSNKVSKTVR